MLMDLREYLFRNRVTLTDFANKIEYDRAYLSLVSNGLQRPSERLAKTISDATEGQVTVEELLSIVPKKTSKKERTDGK